MDAEVGADADKEIVEGVDADEELVPEPDEADGVAGAADDDDGSGQGGFNSRPDGPNVIVFCPASFIFFVLGGISSHAEKRLSRNRLVTPRSRDALGVVKN